MTEARFSTLCLQWSVLGKTPSMLCCFVACLHASDWVRCGHRVLLSCSGIDGGALCGFFVQLYYDFGTFYCFLTTWSIVIDE